jgi:hypothetical protein
MSNDYTILGSGPSALSVIDELILQGIPLNKITVITNSLIEPTEKRNSKRINAKRLIDYNKGQSNFWGASHFPLNDNNTELTRKFTNTEIRIANANNSRMLQIQSENINKGSNVGEVTGKVKRKETAQSWCEKQNVQVQHSRLSVGGHREKPRFCQKKSACRKQCECGAMWKPHAELQILKQNRDKISLKIIYGEIEKINLQKKTISFKSRKDCSFNTLFISLGAFNTCQILNNSMIEFGKLKLLTSPVLIMPFRLNRGINYDDFYNSHDYADLNFIRHTSQGKIQSFTQIYFPSNGLTKKIGERLPLIIRQIIFMLQDKKHYFFAKTGLVMCFLEGSEYKKNKKDLKLEFDKEIKEIKLLLKANQSRLCKFPKIWALKGKGFHSGAIHAEQDGNQFGINSKVFHYLAKQNIYLTDASALPKIQPGPHTNAAGVLARLTVRKRLLNP